MNEKNKDYWHSRIDEIFDRNVREKEIAKIYREQYRSIEKQILELYDKAVNQEITTRTDLYSFHHFQELLKSIEKQNKNIKSKLRKETLSTLKKAYKETFLDVVDMLDSDSQWSVQNSKMLESVLNTKWEGSNFSSRIWKNTDELSRRIKADITTAIVQGTNKDTLVKSIMKDYNAGFAKADRLVRTETMHAVNRAQLDTYKGEGVEEVEWDAGLDERTCEICGTMHGKKYKVGEAPNIMHPNCRCTLVPVIPDSWFDNEYLAERDGKTTVKENNVNKLTDRNKRGIIKEKKQLRIPQVPSSDIVRKIANGEYSTNLSIQQFYKHQEGTPQFEQYKKARLQKGSNPQSILLVNENEAQKIIAERAGTGIVRVDRNGNPKPQESIACDRVIGKYYGKGEYHSTNKATIHYGKKNAHIVPIRGDDFD